jgi:hypothetical protein
MSTETFLRLWVRAPRIEIVRMGISKRKQLTACGESLEAP